MTERGSNLRGRSSQFDDFLIENKTLWRIMCSDTRLAPVIRLIERFIVAQELLEESYRGLFTQTMELKGHVNELEKALENKE